MLQIEDARQLFCSLALLALLAFRHGRADEDTGFARTSGTHFIVDGQPFFSDGFNAYWLMIVASDPAERSKVSAALRHASRHGMRLARTWAFSDGGHRPLQYSPGSYDEDVFKGLDFVLSEAKRFGVYLILSLVNNFEEFGGKRQYVQWARDEGQAWSSDDDFYRNNVTKGFYRSHVKTVLTRINTISGVVYKDDPTIFAWELMNEPRCLSDLSGRTLQAWIREMAAYVKSIDSNHLLEVGMEGFYGDSMPERKQFNAGFQLGTDFISNNLIPGIDFATIHAYPDRWIPGSAEQDQLAFLDGWIQVHNQDAGEILRKPLLVTEFGMASNESLRLLGCASDERDAFFRYVYDAIHASASAGGPCTGGLFWQLLAPGMDAFKDGYEIMFPESPGDTRSCLQNSGGSSVGVVS